MNCVFCKLIREKRYQYEGNDCVAFTPLNPVVPGHLLVVPRTHVEDFVENPAVSADAMLFAAYMADHFGGQYNLITSKGKAATQTVFHLHLHLVPRFFDDGLILPWTNQETADE